MNNNPGFMKNYSNGWGHLVASITVIICVTVLLIFKSIDTTFAATLMTPVILFWFMSGTVNRFSKDVSAQITQACPDPPVEAAKVGA